MGKSKRPESAPAVANGGAPIKPQKKSILKNNSSPSFVSSENVYISADVTPAEDAFVITRTTVESPVSILETAMGGTSPSSSAMSTSKWKSEKRQQRQQQQLQKKNQPQQRLIETTNTSSKDSSTMSSSKSNNLTATANGGHKTIESSIRKKRNLKNTTPQSFVSSQSQIPSYVKKSNLKSSASPSFVSSKSQIPSAASSSVDDSFVVKPSKGSLMSSEPKNADYAFPNDSSSSIVNSQKKSNLKSSASPSFVSSQSQILSAGGPSVDESAVVKPSNGNRMPSELKSDNVSPKASSSKANEQQQVQNHTVDAKRDVDVCTTSSTNATLSNSRKGGGGSSLKNGSSPSYVSSRSQIPSATDASTIEDSFVIASTSERGPISPTPQVGLSAPTVQNEPDNAVDSGRKATKIGRRGSGGRSSNSKKDAAMKNSSGVGDSESVPKKKSNLKNSTSPSFVSSQSQIPSAAAAASSTEDSFVIARTSDRNLMPAELQEHQSTLSQNKPDQNPQQPMEAVGNTDTRIDIKSNNANGTNGGVGGLSSNRKKKSNLKSNGSPSFVSSQSQVPTSQGVDASSKEAFIIKRTKGSLLSSEIQDGSSTPSEKQPQQTLAVSTNKEDDGLPLLADVDVKTKKKSNLKSAASPSFVSSRSQIPSVASSASSNDSFVVKPSKGSLVSAQIQGGQSTPLRNKSENQNKSSIESSLDSKVGTSHSNALSSVGRAPAAAKKKSNLKSSSSPIFVSSRSQIPTAVASNLSEDSFVIKPNKGNPPPPKKPQQQRRRPQGTITRHSNNDLLFVQEEQEVDLFAFANQTLLSRLILNKKFPSASKRLRLFPTEACIWATVKNSDADKRRRLLQRTDSWPIYKNGHVGILAERQGRQPDLEEACSTIRQLPLHMTCLFLGTSDRYVKGEVEQLLIELVDAHPRACSECDYYGRYPLHEAIKWEASLDTVTALMMAAPEVLSRRDRDNLLPKDIRADDDSVIEILNHGLCIWQQSQVEAKLRFQLRLVHSDLNPKEATVKAVRGLAGFRQVPADGEDDAVNGQDDEQSSQLEWSSTLITELYDQNNKLGDMVNKLKKETHFMKGLLDKSKTQHDLEDMYSDIRKKASRQEIFLRDMGFDDTGDRIGKTKEPEEEGISMMSMDPEPPTVLTKYLEYKVGELQGANESLEIENERLHGFIEQRNSPSMKLGEVIDSQRITKPEEVQASIPSLVLPPHEKILGTELHALSNSLNQNSVLRNEVENLREQLAQARAENSKLKNSQYLDVEDDIEDDTEYDVEGEMTENIDDGTTINTDVNYDKMSERRQGTLEDQLKNIDRRSGHDTDPLVEVEAVSATPTKSRRSVTSRAESRASFSSWGLLSLSQQNSGQRKLLKSKKWPKKSPLETHQTCDGSSKTFHTDAFHDSIKSVPAPDNHLAHIRSTTNVNETEKQKPPNRIGPKSFFAFFDGFMRPGKTRGKKCRRFSDGGATPTVDRRKNQLGSVQTSRIAPAPLVDTALLLAADEEITELVKAVEAEMGTEIPQDLVTAIREACVLTASEALQTQSDHSESAFHVWQSVAESLVDHNLIEKAQQLYGETIPPNIVSSLRAASALRLETSREEIAAVETMKSRLDEELLDALLDTADRKLQQPISQVIVACLRVTSKSHGSLLSEACDEFGMLQSIRIDFQALDKMIKASQELYGLPFPQEILVAIRRASFVLQSRLEGTEANPSARDILIGAGNSPASTESNHCSSPHAWSRTKLFSSLIAHRAESAHSSDEYVLPIKGLDGPMPFSSPKQDDGNDIPSRRWSDFATPVRIEPLNFDASGRSHGSQGSSPRRRRSLEGGDDPGFMYRQARARSRSPSSGATNDLDALYDRAFRARSRSPVSETHAEEELEHLYRRASIQRNESNHRRSSKSEDGISKVAQDMIAVDSKESQSDPKSAVAERREQIHESIAHLSEVDAVIEAAKTIVGRDISKELTAALKLVSQTRAEQIESQDNLVTDDDRTREEDEEETCNNEESDDIRSQALSMSITSEGSMDIAAVFQKDPPEKSTKKSRKKETGAKSPSKEKAQRTVQSFHASLQELASRRSGMSPVRGVRKANSGDLDAFLSKSKGIARTEDMQRSKSMDVDVGSKGLSSSGGKLKTSTSCEGLVTLAEKVGTDDLDALYKHAKEKVAEGSSLMASTHHMPNRSGHAAFDTVISDTEETYGIEVPGSVVDALKKAVLGSASNVSIISIVRSLHDDLVISIAESYRGESIPDDLLYAIRASSLPPGVSIEAIMPGDENVSVSESGSADQSKKSSRGSMSFFEASTEMEETSGEIESITLDEREPPALSPPPSSKSVFESHYGEFAVSKEDLEKSQEELDAELVKVKSKSATGQVSGGARPSRIRRSPKKSSDGDSMDNSGHSTNSWGGLSLSKSPAVSRRKSSKSTKSTKKHQKGTKAAKFEQAKSERAQKKRDKVNQFMNSLADLGDATDDLRELYNQAKDTLHEYSPITEERKTPVGSPPRPAWGDKKGEAELHPTSEPRPIITESTNVPRPLSSESCLAVSPQELELDMLFDAAQAESGSSLPFDIDIALRKASRSMDESLDFIAPTNQQISQRHFGSHLPLQRLEILYQEAEVFLGGELPIEAITAVKRAVSTLRSLGNAKESETTKSLEESRGHKLQTNQAGLSVRPSIPAQEDRSQRVKSDGDIPEGNGVAKDPRMNWGRNNSAPLPSLSSHSIEGHSIDSLQSVAQGNEDDLRQLYKAAYAESPRTNSSSNSSQNPKLASNSLPRVEEFETEPFFSPKIASFEGTRKRSSSPAVVDATSVAASSGGSSAGKLQEPASPPREEFSPPVPSFNTPPKKRRNAPVSEISAESLSQFLERTDSGKWVGGNVSPMTAASMGTAGDMSEVDLKSAVARLKALSETLPDLNGDDGEMQEEEILGDREMEILGDREIQKSMSTHRSLEPSSGSPEGDELDAIIAEAQRQYGMTLPDELIEALRKASVSTETTEGGMEHSFHDSTHSNFSYLSSLLMLKLDLASEDGTRDDTMQRELVLNLARKESLQSEMTHFTSANASRLSPATFFGDLVKAAELELGKPIAPETARIMRGLFLHKSDSSSLSRVELKLRLDSTLEQLGEMIPHSVHTAFEVGFEKLATSFSDQDSKRTRATIGNASGYFSAVSESEDVSVLCNEFDENEGNLEEIFDELKNVNGAIPKELAERLKAAPPDNDGSIDLDALNLQSSGSTLAYSASTMAASTMVNSIRTSGSTLAYSVSTMGAESTSQQLLKETALKSLGDDKGFDRFMTDASREYGGDFPCEVKATLRSMWESGINLNSHFDPREVRRQAREEFGVYLSDEVMHALKKASRAKFVMEQARELSIISALSDSGSMAESFNSSADLGSVSEDVDNVGAKENKTSTSKEQPSLRGPPPPMPEGTSGGAGGKANINIGPNLLREVRKVYLKKIPLELSHVLTKSESLPFAMNTDEDIDIILSECEEMTGKRLPADLVLSLREASVNLRTPNTSSRSRRSRFVRQSSGSLRSVSRSSGMPSIQEWTTGSETEDAAESKGKQVEVDRVPTPGNADRASASRNAQDWSTSLETDYTMEKQEVKVDRVPRPRNSRQIPNEIMAKEQPSKEAIQRTGSLPSREPVQNVSSLEAKNGSIKSLGSMGSSTGLKNSSHSGGESSIKFEALKDPDMPPKAESANHASGFSMGSITGLKNSAHSHLIPSAHGSAAFNNSTATQMHSNQSNGSTWRPDKLEFLASSSMDSSLHDTESSDGSDEDPEKPLSLSRRSQHSTGSSTSTEITSNNTLHSNTIHSTVSAASTLTSRKLPIGVNPSPPLPDVESDDLSFIFKEAAKRF